MLRTTPLSHMPSPPPRRNRWVRASFAFPNGGGLPRILGGAASALPFSRPARRSPHAAAHALAESLTAPFLRKLRPLCYRRGRSDRLLAGTTLAGSDSHPPGPRTFARHTGIRGLARASPGLARASPHVSPRRLLNQKRSLHFNEVCPVFDVRAGNRLRCRALARWGRATATRRRGRGALFSVCAHMLATP